MSGWRYGGSKAKEEAMLQRLDALAKQWAERHDRMQERVEQLEQTVEDRNKHIALLTDQVEELSFRLKVVESQQAPLQSTPSSTATLLGTSGASLPPLTAGPTPSAPESRRGSRRQLRRRHTAAGTLERRGSFCSTDAHESALSRRSSTRSVSHDESLVRPLDQNSITGQPVFTISAYGVDSAIVGPANYQHNEDDLRMPTEKVELERVYGYQGRRCRNNLHYIQGGDNASSSTLHLTYNVASLGVVLDAATGKQRYYIGHNQEIRCLTVHPQEDVVATGQKSGLTRASAAHIRLWSGSSLETVRVLGGDNQLGDAVTCLAFSSFEPDVLASVHESDGGMQHLIIWNWRSGTPLAEAKAIHPEPIFTLAFNPRMPTLVTAGKNALTFWNIATAQATTTTAPTTTTPGAPPPPSSSSLLLSSSTSSTQQDSPPSPGIARVTLTKRPALYQPHPRPKAVLAVMFAPSGRTITGDSNGSILVWKRPVPTYNVERRIEDAHVGGVYCLQATEFGFISGGKDNLVKLWTWDFEMFPIDAGEVNTIDVGACVRCIACVPTVDGPSLSQFVVGTTANFVVFVDAGAGSVGQLVPGHADDVTCVRAHPRKANTMLTVSADGSVRAWDTATHTELWRRHSFVVEDEEEDEVPVSGDFHPITDDVAVGSSTGTLYILDAAGAVSHTLSQAKSAVTCASYSPSGAFLACGTKHGFLHIYTTADYQLLFAAQAERDDQVTAIDWLLDESYLQVACLSNTFYVSMGEQRVVNATETAITCDWYTRTCPLSWEAQGTRQSLTKGATAVSHCSRSSNKALIVAGDNQGRLTVYKYPCYSTKAAGLTRYLHSSAIGGVAFESSSRCILSGGTGDACMMQWKVVPAPERPTSTAASTRSNSVSTTASFVDSSSSSPKTAQPSTATATTTATATATTTTTHQPAEARNTTTAKLSPAVTASTASIAAMSLSAPALSAGGRSCVPPLYDTYLEWKSRAAAALIGDGSGDDSVSSDAAGGGDGGANIDRRHLGDAENEDRDRGQGDNGRDKSTTPTASRRAFGRRITRIE
ncbi:hypothetical protein PTSG_09714 [Salpingoeca rosetta]|uniref:Uncharacterized protein n=1 Tax=Salpingoeca rosetta (strain ATCC 50818 / BSB-021) TaxID=946362 RepID=F2UNU3_SALR5|nr:uncharacterized protein PTSG_09714 [Salpingoeca rosetta]EGD79298.1 hypothetical protein PTSG_09714 [Salpingoeca rosetta]|eukprot:XP_004989069.1 hypothetical protein PTSG_09714 [Salpingoeca rosetta]